MKRFLTSVLILVFVSGASAQAKRKFDDISYVAPAGWQLSETTDSLQLSIGDNSTGNYCVIYIFKAVQATADPKINFNNSLEAFKNQSFRFITDLNTTQIENQNGWVFEAGSIGFEKAGNRGVLLLISGTANAKVVNVLVVTNTDIYSAQADKFLESVDFPVVNAGRTVPQTQNGSQNGAASNSSGKISKNVTNFDDGWTSTLYEDYVLVEKPSSGVNVYLFFPVELTDEMRPPQNQVSSYMWQSVVQRNFNITSANFINDRYIVGVGSEAQTGRLTFVAMYVVVEEGIAKVAVAAAQSVGHFQTRFPHPDNLAEMTKRNKFALTVNDLIGNWEGGDTVTSQLYGRNNYNQGYNYQGMYFSSSTDQFKFANGGVYQSRHSGSFGQVGNTRNYDDKYAGKFQVSGWGLTMTNRRDETDFSGYFEAVRGGKILHLRNRKYSGIEYHLVKTD